MDWQISTDFFLYASRTSWSSTVCGESEDDPRKAVNVFGAITLDVVNL